MGLSAGDVAISPQMALRTNPTSLPAGDRAASSVLKDRWWWGPAAALFKFGVRLRHRLYDAGILKEKEGALPTVVLGNVTVGGTGKTPHLKVLLQRLMDKGQGERWAVLSRGYGRKTTGFQRVDRTGTPAEFGDEPLELARRFPGVPVFVCEDRLEGLKRIAETGLADAVVLDDGLQHRRLKPTLSLMLVDTTQPVDRDRFLPRGRLRDLPERVSKADAVILTRCPSPYTKGDLRLWRHRLRLRPDQPLLHTGTQTAGLRAMATKRYAGWPSNCIAVSGLANPAQFEHQLSRQCRVLHHFAYPDHHTFTAADLDEWCSALGRDVNGRTPAAIITTEKDAERIRPLEGTGDLPILVVNLKIQWWDEEPLGALLSTLRKKVGVSQDGSDI